MYAPHSVKLHEAKTDRTARNRGLESKHSSVINEQIQPAENQENQNASCRTPHSSMKPLHKTPTKAKQHKIWTKFISL